MNISDGSQLKKRKAITAPNMEKAKTANTISSARKKDMPNASRAMLAIVPPKPSSPSIRLNEFVITMMVKIVTA
jgi:hypothetical protein